MDPGQASSSHIPPLASLRTNQNPAAKRPSRRPAAVKDADDFKASDHVVQQTDNDALVSRLSAIQLGYLVDPFAAAFASAQPERRYPVINRGTYVRSTSIDLLVTRFLNSHQGTRKQIISLGAGTDSRFWRLATTLENAADLVYHEIDFPQVAARKIRTINGTPLLRAVVDRFAGNEPVTFDLDRGCFFSRAYNMHSLDLRDLTPTAAAEEGKNPVMNLPNVNPTSPTLLLSECCLIYLPPASADSILKFFTQTLFPPTTPLAIVLYEPTNPLSPFGKVMVSNLAARGIVLQTLKKYSSLDRQKERLRVLGFGTGQGAADSDFIWNQWVPGAEKERIAKLEMMDEVEEWRLLASHYCTAWAWRDGVGDVDGNNLDTDWFHGWTADLALQYSQMET